MITATKPGHFSVQSGTERPGIGDLEGSVGHTKGADGELPDPEERDNRALSADPDRGRGERTGDTANQENRENRTVRGRKEEDQEKV